MTEIAFIDLEASGLGAASWPIEVGWCLERGKAHSFLIRPADSWPPDAWSAQAEALHGISMDQLIKKGRAIAEACRRLNDALSGRAVYSDAPDWDGFWLYRLFKTGGVRQDFQIHSFSDLFQIAGDGEIRAAVADAQEQTPHRHRAAADVLHMRAVYKILRR